MNIQYVQAEEQYIDPLKCNNRKKNYQIFIFFKIVKKNYLLD